MSQADSEFPPNSAVPVPRLCSPPAQDGWKQAVPPFSSVRAPFRAVFSQA